MVDMRVILFGALALVCMGASGAVASPGDDQVAEYLDSHNMLSLLELQLEDRIADAKDKDERIEFAEKLSGIYLEQLKSYTHGDPYRELIVNRAYSLTKRMGSIPMYALRIELLIDGYLGVDPKVELARLELLNDEDRAYVIARLTGIKHKLKALTLQLDPAVTRLERLNQRGKASASNSNDTLADLRRYRSLAHYYHAWSGYSLAVLKDQRVPSDVFVSFGWLLGAQGELPELASFNTTTLEYDHVARSAIGVAMSYAQADEMLLGRSWIKAVVESEDVPMEAKRDAEDRLLQVLAIERDWTEAYRWIITLANQRNEDNAMSVPDARFVSLRSLEALESKRVGRGGASEAKKVARHAIEQLVAHDEIGHVLDLYRRFDSLPMLANSFITSYARALGELNEAEQAGEHGLYSSVAELFAQALGSNDANRFPKERDDCSLKLAYAEIRSGRAKEAIKICEELVEQSPRDQVIEEARWMRIAAIESVNAVAGRVHSDKLEQAVREYITAYPATDKSAKLILRHAMQGTVDSRVAIDTLRAIGDDDPIAIPARRALVSLRYKQLRSMGYSDQESITQILGIVRWINEHQALAIEDLNDAQSRLGTIRIGIDLAFRAAPVKVEFAENLIEQGIEILAFDRSLVVHRAEFVYRQVELAVRQGRIDDAIGFLEELEPLDVSMYESARVMLLNDSILRWQSEKSIRVARRLVNLGTSVLSKQLPAYPAIVGSQLSKVAEVIAESADYLWTRLNDEQSRDLALRMSLLVLDRGQPSEPGLRRTALLTNSAGDSKNELESWLRLLAAYPSSDDRWYEARYESLRVMFGVDAARARKAYTQFKVLHPSRGPEPWNTKMAILFGERTRSEEGAP